MPTSPVQPLLDRFVTALREQVGPVAVWVHGSFALGDHQPGRSDLDLLAVVDAAPDRDRIGQLHRRLDAEPFADRLHCSYLRRDQLTDPEQCHLTWAHRHLLERPVTPVTRRELAIGGRTLHGATPAELIPDVTDDQLRDFVRTDLAGFWRPATRHPTWWLRDVWVDLGPITVARAGVTLAEGRLISKGEALRLLAATGAPARLCADIHRRRYETAVRLGPLARLRRAQLARRLVRDRIDALLGD
ncbi:nucleotidyltransferase [Actinocatenispora thailandica]|uniref:Nucleotidyltransferase n=1 Tax=Actinocatenispora thailandica TaxID=227318 RepID=A0A7R7HW04_9ACTN|nr:nucleotidyltransferase domain-containing protein [Actinocatenispora thailandica]BCJ34582.1 nucleotidyltransferase [Actinocatenispora thailandica]